MRTKFYNEIGPIRIEKTKKNSANLLNKKIKFRFINVTKESILEILKENNITKSSVRFLDRFWVSKYDRLT
jgi:hypothetical protein